MTVNLDDSILPNGNAVTPRGRSRACRPGSGRRGCFRTGSRTWWVISLSHCGDPRITFTNKAAADARPPRGADRPGRPSDVVMTFHAFCVRILRADGRATRFSRCFTIYDEDDTRLIGAVLAELDLDPKRYPPKMVARASRRPRTTRVRSRVRRAGRHAPDKAVAKAFPLYQKRLLGRERDGLDDLLVNAGAC